MTKKNEDVTPKPRMSAIERAEKALADAKAKAAEKATKQLDKARAERDAAKVWFDKAEARWIKAQSDVLELEMAVGLADTTPAPVQPELELAEV